MNPQTQLNQLQRILAISQSLITNRSRDDILRQIVQVVTDVIECETAGILLADESSQTLHFIVTALHQDQLYNIPVPMDASIAGAAFTSGQPVIVRDASQDPRYYRKIAEMLDYEAHSILAVPLEFRDRKIGVLQAENKTNHQAFDENDASILTALAIQASIAIENTRQFELYQQSIQAESNQHQIADALRSASAMLTSTLDYHLVIDRILEQIRLVIPSDTSNVMMIEAGNIARVFRGRGYAEYGTAETLTSTILDISRVAGLRRMIETRQPLVIPDVMQDPTWVYSRPEHHWIRSYIGAPIIVRDAVIGFLSANSATPNHYHSAHGEHLQTFALHAAIAIENARLYRQAQDEIAERIKAEEALRQHRDQLEDIVKERTAEIQRLAITDSLTGLYNRRHLLDLGNQMIEQTQRYRRPATAMMIDIDHFKLINDTYGHAAGDLALSKLAECLRNNLRAVDILGRYGGEEFVILMPETDLDAAKQTAERLLGEIRGMRIQIDHAQIGFTASIGAAEWLPAQTSTIDHLINLADHAMYTAKHTGRDRVATHTET